MTATTARRTGPGPGAVDVRPHAARPDRRARSGLLIAVGVRDPEHDATTIRWAVDEAAQGVDTVHLAHAYLPLRLPGCSWEPVVRERDGRYLAARRVVARAMHRIGTDLSSVRAGGSVIAGLPEDVLAELSGIVDLLVIGDDADAPHRTRAIAWRVQDTARCPVVCVPAGAPLRSDSPVAVVVGEDGLHDAVLGVAVDAARRRSVAVHVSQSWSSLHVGAAPGAAWLAHQQEALDLAVADRAGAAPDVPFLTTIELCDDWAAPLRAASSLVVISQAAAPTLRGHGTAGGAACPVVVVPTDVTRRADSAG